MKPATYPVVEERALGAPARQGFLNLRGRRREASELPQPAAHQVRVYRSGGAFHVDRGGLALDDNRVVEADHVSLVDVGHDVAVVVVLSIPSAEDDEFEVRTTFACTVIDPVTVVSEGRGDADRFLTGYMRRYDKLPQIAQNLRLADINDVRELVWSHVKAFIDLSPPEVRGMRIEYVGTEVLTPNSLRETRGTWRTTRHEQEVEVARTEHDHLMKEKVTNHTRTIMAGLSEAVQNDTINAVMLALAEGRIDPTEVAHRITAERERALTREWEREEAERQERQRQGEWERDLALRRETWAREDEHRRMQVRSQLAQTAIRENYVDGAMTAAEVVDFVDPEMFPMRTESIGSGERNKTVAEPAVDTGEIVAQTGEDPRSGGGRTEGDHVLPREAAVGDGPENGVRGRRSYSEGLSEDDHDA
ncbi:MULTISPECIES: hypothetical protein [Nocardiopsidaceae]|uniref:Band 7 domain-containing protein n=1 Tax=Streptomonospora nanhaiensis TaxID=1323731 RepID=A0ABY6YLZ5_9ACTN|nr:hypothetical protein [Streptomonospora nanhaiensis]WAE73315.1 hypothetical protein OUQ99_29935 [Streptomonospora nanhaiensis]